MSDTISFDDETSGRLERRYGSPDAQRRRREVVRIAVKPT